MGKMILDVNNICKSYNNGQKNLEVLKNLSLQIIEKEIITISGQSGCGKSTALNILVTLDKPDSGTVLFKGSDINEFNEKELSLFRNTKIGFVFQSLHLLARNSALSNVMLPLRYAGFKEDEAEDRAKDVLDQVGLIDRMDHTPSELSGGQQQRVAIARALVNKPSIIFADEPTGNLDSKTGEDVMNLFKDLNNQGQTIILITHEEDIAKQSKRIINIKDGLIESDKRT